MIQKIDHGIDVFYGVIQKVFSTLNAIMVAVLTSVVICDIVGTLLKYPITFTVELTGIMFAWITGLSGVLIAIDDGNIALTFIRDKFKGRAKWVLVLIIDLLSLVFSVVMCIASIQVNSELHMQRMAMLQCSKSVLYMSMVVMFFFISIVMLTKIFRLFTRKEDE